MATEPVYDRLGVQVLHDDCLTALAGLDDNSVDAVIVDPPYGLSEHKPADVVTAITAWANGDRNRVPSRRSGFMGQEWDSFVPPPAVWDECLRVLRPGGHLACFAGSRTVDLMTLSVRMAGFEIRDTIAAWLYSSGFPKSLDVGKAIDKAAGAERIRNLVQSKPGNSIRRGEGEQGSTYGDSHGGFTDLSEPATDDARRWDGWGTALAPAFEPIILARKPLSGTVAQTVVEHGTGGLNIDACRTGMGDDRTSGGATGKRVDAAEGYMGGWADADEGRARPSGGRWPKNAVLAHHPDCADTCDPDCHVRALDEQSGDRRSGTRSDRATGGTGTVYTAPGMSAVYGDSGGASRFFPTFRYQAKAPRSERPTVDGVAHPTVKPLALLRWLVRLLTPPGGLVLDCFAGSGTTGQAARAEGMRALLIERHDPYIPLIRARLDRDQQPGTTTAQTGAADPQDALPFDEAS